MARYNLREPTKTPKIEARLNDTKPRNMQDSEFSIFKKSTKAENMLNEISTPNLGVAEVRELGKTQDIHDKNVCTVRDHLLRKAFNENWTLKQLKKMVKSVASGEKYRMRKELNTNKIVTKQASEIKELKHELKVIKNAVAKQDLRIEDNAEQIEGNAEELQCVFNRVNCVEVSVGKHFDSINMLAEQVGKVAKTVEATSLSVNEQVAKVVKTVEATSLSVNFMSSIIGPLREPIRREQSPNFSEPRNRKRALVYSNSINPHTHVTSDYATTDELDESEPLMPEEHANHKTWKQYKSGQLTRIWQAEQNDAE